MLFENLDDVLSSLGNNMGFILLSTVLCLLYYYYTSTFDCFKKKRVPFLKPVIFLGNLWPRLRASKSFHKFQLEIYDHFKGSPLGGTFQGRRPILYIFDPEIIKTVLVRDFDNFTDRSSLVTGEPGYLIKSLLNLKGSEWKGVRNAVTPAFSSVKLKNMFPLITRCTDQMVEDLIKHVNTEVELKQTMGHFTLDVIGACAFGIKCDALTGDNEYFYNAIKTTYNPTGNFFFQSVHRGILHDLKVARKFDYIPTHKRIILFVVLIFMPDLIRYLRMSLLNLDSTDELMKILQASKAIRDQTNSRENDFLQILINLGKKEKPELGNINNSGKYLDDETIDAQCLLFLIAGYETSSTLLSFAIHELAVNQQLQDKLRAHIKDVTDGKEISYDLLSELLYLDGFLLEILRLYPPGAQIHRVCTKPYTIPNTSVHLNVGDAIAVPVYGIHMDPKYYPEPHECRPERFLGDEKKERPSHLFLAFGAGPRNCIGSRFAMMTVKTAMVSLMEKFKFSACSRTVHPIEFDKKSMLLKPEKGLWVRIESL